MKTIHFEQDEDIIDIRYDNVFKSVFTRETRESRTALSRLVSAMIGKDITIKSILANEPPIENLKDRQVRFDINCRAKDGELIDVEMCFNPEVFEPIRLEFHAGKLFSGQDIKGKRKGYNDLKRVYQIAILAKERFFKDENIYHSFEYYDPISRIPLNGKSRIITLELSKVEKVVNKPIAKMSTYEFWAVFMECLTDKEKRDIINEIVRRDKGIAMAGRVVMRISRDEEERARIMRDEKIILDWQSSMVYFSKIKRDYRKVKKDFDQARQELTQARQEATQVRQEMINLLKSGKSPEEIISQYDG